MFPVGPFDRDSFERRRPNRLAPANVMGSINMRVDIHARKTPDGWFIDWGPWKAVRHPESRYPHRYPQPQRYGPAITNPV